MTPREIPSPLAVEAALSKLFRSLSREVRLFLVLEEREGFVEAMCQGEPALREYAAELGFVLSQDMHIEVVGRLNSTTDAEKFADLFVRSLGRNAPLEYNEAWIDSLANIVNCHPFFARSSNV